MVQRCTHKCLRNSSTTITTYPICIRIDSPYYLRLFSFPRLSDTDCRAYPSYVPRISSSPLQFHAASDEQPACATNYKSNQRTSSLRTAVYDSKFVQDHSPLRCVWLNRACRRVWRAVVYPRRENVVAKPSWWRLLLLRLDNVFFESGFLLFVEITRIKRKFKIIWKCFETDFARDWLWEEINLIIVPIDRIIYLWWMKRKKFKSQVKYEIGNLTYFFLSVEQRNW